MDYHTVIQHYLQALQDGNTKRIESLFEPESLVYSPFLGRVPVAEFFKRLAEASSRAIITHFDTFISTATSNRRAAAYFRYDWTLKDGTTTSFDCVDVFEFSDVEGREDKILSLTIVYDTHPVRQQVGDKYNSSTISYNVKS
jgi:hypothetical protein